MFYFSAGLSYETVSKNASINIKPIYNSSGLYFHNQGHARFHSHHWELVTYFDVTFFKAKLDFLYDRYDQVKYICQWWNESKVCPIAMKSVFKIMTDLTNAHNELRTAMNHHRSRRSIFTGGQKKHIGWLADARALGTTYSSDYYDEAIDGLIANAPRMNIIRAKYSKLDQRIDELENTKNNITSEFKNIQELYYTSKLMLSKTIKFMEYMAGAASLTQNQFGLLSQVMMFLKADVIKNGLFTKSQFLNELKNVPKSQIGGTQFAFPLDDMHVDDLIRTSKFIKFFGRNKIVFVFQVPLVGPVFDLYSVLPIPVFNELNFQLFAFINPLFPYFAKSKSGNEYALIRDLNVCHQIGNNTKLCKNHLIYSENLTPICESTLLNDTVDVLPKYCLPYYRNGLVLIAHPLTPTKWLLAASATILLRVTCNGVNNVYHFNSTAVLTVPESCTILINGSHPLSQNLTTYASEPDLTPSADIWRASSSYSVKPIEPVDSIKMLTEIETPFSVASVLMETENIKSDSVNVYFVLLLRTLGVVLSGLFLYMTWQLCATFELKKAIRK